MEHDADRGTQIRGQPLDNPGENLDAAGRGTDHHQVVMPVRLRVYAITFHTDSVRSDGVPYQLSRRRPKGIPARR